MTAQPKPILLSGGIGSRLWPLSNVDIPKQFLKIASKHSPFQRTILRNQFLERPTIIVGREHLQLMNKQLNEISVSDVDIIVEPSRKNTAAASLLASLHAEELGYESILLLPCDHEINDDLQYENTIQNAVVALNQFDSMTIGIEPDGFSSEFGYIETESSTEKFQSVVSFKEKPQNRQALTFQNGRNYFWNSGIYLLKSQCVLDSLRAEWPCSFEHISNAFQFSKKLGNITYPSKTFYAKAENNSFDVVFSEKASNMGMVKAEFDWSDLGTWPSLLKHILSSTSFACDDSSNKHWVLNNSYSDEDIDCPAILSMQHTLAISHQNRIIIAKKENFEKVMNFYKEDFYIRTLGRTLLDEA